MLKNADAQILEYKSAEKLWVTPGRADVTFDGSFIPDQGPNGGVVVIDYMELHSILNLTITVAAMIGEDLLRAFRKVTAVQVDGEARYQEVKGDTLRHVSYAMCGADSTVELADIAAGGGAGDVTISCLLPFAKPYAYESDDTSLPAYLFRELKIGMAQAADMSLGACVCTINSGTYWVIAICHEEMAAVHHAFDVITEQEFDTTATGTLPVNGRLQDLFLFVRGATGGASLANLTDVSIQTANIMPQAFLKNPDLQQRYVRRRSAATNSNSTKGNPVRADPFLAAAGGTLRACAVLLTAGDKVWEGPEVKNVMVKTTLAGALTPITMISRATKRKTKALRDTIMQTHDVNASYIKTSGKTRRGHGQWTPEQAAYLPEKFYKGFLNAKGEMEKVKGHKLFAGRKP